jgi:hypothetical protein
MLKLNLELSRAVSAFKRLELQRLGSERGRLTGEDRRKHDLASIMLAKAGWECVISRGEDGSIARAIIPVTIAGETPADYQRRWALVADGRVTVTMPDNSVVETTQPVLLVDTNVDAFFATFARKIATDALSRARVATAREAAKAARAAGAANSAVSTADTAVLLDETFEAF